MNRKFVVNAAGYEIRFPAPSRDEVLSWDALHLSGRGISVPVEAHVRGKDLSGEFRALAVLLVSNHTARLIVSAPFARSGVIATDRIDAALLGASSILLDDAELYLNGHSSDGVAEDERLPEAA